MIQTISRTEALRMAINRRLAAESIDHSDKDKAIKSLSKCVMSAALVKEFNQVTKGAAL